MDDEMRDMQSNLAIPDCLLPLAGRIMDADSHEYTPVNHWIEQFGDSDGDGLIDYKRGQDSGLSNQGWKDKHHALDMIHWLHEKGIVMIEQPMPKEQLDDIAWVTQQSPLPIFADESIQRLKDVAGLKGAFTGINIKLMKCTGMREAWKMVTLARALDMKVMVGCMTETSCAITAASQFSPAVDFADLDGSLLIANDRFKGMEVVKGKITLPDLPGIGVVKL